MATIKIVPTYGDSFSTKDLNMFVLSRHMDEANLTVLFMRRRNKGDIIIKTTSIPDQDFFTTKFINHVPVKISLPENMNYITGRIYHPEMEYMTVDEINQLLLNSGEDHDRLRMHANFKGANIYWMITKRRELPASVLLGWDRVKVAPLKPRPVRCYHCQSYGHIAPDCTKPSVCPICSGNHDVNYDCRENPKCPACDGPHTVFDPECPAWLEETEIAKIKKEEKLSYRDALKRREEIKKEENKNEDNKKEDDEEDTDDTEDSDEDVDVEIEERRQVTPRPQRKRKNDQEQEDQDETIQKQEVPQTPTLGQSDHGEWRTVTSRHKKKAFSQSKHSS